LAWWRKRQMRHFFWLELIIDARLLKAKRIRPLMVEADEIVAIMATSRKSALANRHSAIT